MNRKLAWEHPNIIAPRHFAFKGFVCSAWRGQDPRTGGRWVDTDHSKKSKEESSSRGIEDVEQNAVDELLEDKNGLYDRVRARSKVWLMSANSAINPILGSAAGKQDMPRQTTYGPEDFQKRFQRFQSQQSPEPNQEYEIDPITNRKVFKNKTSESRKPIEVPVETFKGYRSQFHDFSPPASQATEPVLKTYIPPSNPTSPTVGDTGKRSDPTRENLKEYEKNNQCRPLFRSGTEGQITQSKYEDPVGKNRRGSFETSFQDFVYDVHEKARQSDQPDKARECLKEYEKNNPVGPIFAREPDGKLPEEPDTVRESLKIYEEKHPVGSVFAREPDGKLPEKPCPVQEGLKAYDVKVTYGPYMAYEPDGKPPPKPDPVAEGLRDFDERADYGRRRILKNTHIGKVGSGQGGTDPSFRYPSEDTKEDLDLLRPSDVRAASGIIRGTKLETEAEKLAMRRNLEDDFQKQQHDYTSTCEDIPTAKQIKLQCESKARDLLGLLKTKHEAQAAGIQETREKLINELKIENSELRNVEAHLKGRVDTEIAKVSAELFIESPQSKMTGNFVRDFPEEFEGKWTPAQDSGALEPEKAFSNKNAEPAPKESFFRNADTPRIQTSLDRTATGKKDEQTRLQNEIDPYSRVPRGLETSYEEEKEAQRLLEIERDPYSKVQQGLETSFAKEKAEEAKLQNERDPYSKEPMGLEISYAKEKAEEAKLQNERDPYSKVPIGLEISYAQEKAEAAKLQNEKDPYSKKPMGLETSYIEEVATRQAEGDLSLGLSSFGKHNEAEKEKRARQLAKQEKKKLMKQMDRDLVCQIRSIYEEKYGKLDSKHRQVPEATTLSEPVNSSESMSEDTPLPETQEPTVYKILAYDTTMQEINTAETTSIVPDSASALTPAEVLLRLSNPAKFFPHFQPLQAEGYEIISGSGDVLVFRKVRPAGSRGSKNESVSSIQDLKRKIINPIDGMQSSPIAATGNFASPTGFVNHDLPVSEPRFKSNIDVRREESVFSGKPNWQEESESTRRKSKGRGKRLLIGAAWVAGCSYAIGVVAEYFRTGGMDGRGPQGF